MTALAVPLEQLFIGTLRPLPPEGQMTGMYKYATSGAQTLGTTGLHGDEQADPRHHGGPYKALHHFPAEHYDDFARRWPERAAILRPGVMGENLSTHGLTEDGVCIGDIYALGNCRIQVSQPRQPCWKINHRLETPGASSHVAESGRTGWYYQVLQGGSFATGDTLTLVERPSPWLTLAQYWNTINAHRPDVALLRRIAAAPGLAPDKAQRHADRANWLEIEAAR